MKKIYSVLIIGFVTLSGLEAVALNDNSECYVKKQDE